MTSRCERFLGDHICYCAVPRRIKKRTASAKDDHNLVLISSRRIIKWSWSQEAQEMVLRNPKEDYLFSYYSLSDPLPQVGQTFEPEFSLVISSENPAARIPVGKAKRPIPLIAITPPKNCLPYGIGYRHLLKFAAQVHFSLQIHFNTAMRWVWLQSFRIEDKEQSTLQGSRLRWVYILLNIFTTPPELLETFCVTLTSFSALIFNFGLITHSDFVLWCAL